MISDTGHIFMCLIDHLEIFGEMFVQVFANFCFFVVVLWF